jgi:uncharacterized membrane protein
MSEKGSRAIKARHWIELFLPIMVIGIIVGNSFYLKGYDCTSYSFDTGIVEQYYGYTQSDNTFQYNGEDESPYILMNALSQHNDQLAISFSNCPDEDISVQLLYYDDEGTISDQVEETVWKKGSYLLKFGSLREGATSKYLVVIPADFTFQTVYFAVDNGISNIKLFYYYFIFAIFALVVTGSVLFVPSLSKRFLSIEQKVISFFNEVKTNRKVIGKYTLCFLGTILVCELIGYFIQSKMGYGSSEKTYIVYGAAGILISIFVFFHCYMEKKIELTGFFVILLTGTVICFTEPSCLGVSLDDETHYSNVVSLSHMFDRKESIADQLILNDQYNVAINKYNYSRAEQQRSYQIYDELERLHYYVARTDTVLNNVVISYVPSAVGLMIGRGLGLPFHMVVYMGRWMNVWMVAILSYFAMKRLQTGKIVVMLIALLPTNIFLTSNYTYDVWLTAWSIFGLSSFFGEWQQPEKKITWKTALTIALPMFLAVMPKLVYFPLTFITLFMPAKKFQSKKDCWIYRASVLVAALLPFAFAYMNNLSGDIGQGDARGGGDVNSTSQMDFVKSNPVQAMKIICNFLKGYLNPFVEGNEYITRMTYVGYSPIDSKYLLIPIILGAGVSRREKETKFPWWTKAGVLLVYAVIGFIAAFSMYISFTAVGATEVAGCQGRYLIPALFPLLYVWTRFSGKTRVKNVLRAENINILFMAFLVFVTIWTLMVGCINLY